MSSVDACTLRLNRRFDAPIDEVFAAFVDADLLRQWWGPEGFRVVEIDFVAAVERRYRVTLLDPAGARYTHEGTFLEVERPTRLRFTWTWTEGPLARNETAVTICFAASGSSTIVSVEHARFASAAERDRHRGWAESLGRLAGVLSNET